MSGPWRTDETSFAVRAASSAELAARLDGSKQPESLDSAGESKAIYFETSTNVHNLNYYLTVERREKMLPRPRTHALSRSLAFLREEESSIDRTLLKSRPSRALSIGRLGTGACWCAILIGATVSDRTLVGANSNLEIEPTIARTNGPLCGRKFRKTRLTQRVLAAHDSSEALCIERASELCKQILFSWPHTQMYSLDSEYDLETDNEAALTATRR